MVQFADGEGDDLSYSRQHGFKKNSIDIADSNLDLTQVNVEDAGLDYSRKTGFKKSTIEIEHNNLDTDLHQAKEENMN